MNGFGTWPSASCTFSTPTPTFQEALLSASRRHWHPGPCSTESLGLPCRGRDLKAESPSQAHRLQPVAPMGVGSLQTDSLETPCPCTPWEASVASQPRQPPRCPEHVHHSVNTTVPAGPQHGGAGSGQPRVGWALGSAFGLGPAFRSCSPPHRTKGAIEEDTEGEQCGRDPVTPCAPLCPSTSSAHKGSTWNSPAWLWSRLTNPEALRPSVPRVPKEAPEMSLSRNFFCPKTSPGLWHGPSLRHPFT